MAPNIGSHNETSYVFKNPEEARMQLDKEIKEFFNLAFERKKSGLNVGSFVISDDWTIAKPSGLRRQIVATAGLGKTRSVEESLSLCKGMNIWFMVPNDKLAREIFSNIKTYQNIDAYLIEGRNEKTCMRYMLAQEMGELGVGTQAYLCKKDDKKFCPHFNDCPYQLQLGILKDLRKGKLSADDNPRIFVAAHNYLTLPNFLPPPDIVIVDESHWRTFCEVVSLNLDAAEKAANPNKEYYAEYIKTIVALRTAKGKPFFKHFSELGLTDISFAIKHMELVLKSLNVPFDPETPDAKILSEIEKIEHRQLRKILTCLKQLNVELSLQSHAPKSMIWINEKNIHFYTLKEPCIPAEASVLLIDASADLNINSKIWGPELEERRIEVERNAMFIQVNKSFSKYSLGFAKNGDLPDDDQLHFQEQAISAINYIAEKNKGPVFLAAPKMILEGIKDRLHPNVKTAHFNNLRGLDQFRDCEVGIILGRELPPAESVISLARCLVSHSKELFLPSDEYFLRKGQHTLRDGSKIDSNNIHMFGDSITQSVLTQIRDKELEQAIDRLRLVHNEKTKRVYIFSNIPLNMRVDRIWSWSEFLEGGPKIEQVVARSLQKGRAIPLGYTAWQELFPDLWNSKEGAKNYQKDNGGIKWVENQLIYLLGNHPFITVSYRKENGRGRSSHAIVDANEECPQITLERVVGPVKDFKIIGPFGTVMGDVHMDEN